METLDLFAGPGGWDEGIRGLGIDGLGIEIDPSACQTRREAGHRTLEADISELDPAKFSADLLIASPPCPTFSVAGDQNGQILNGVIVNCARALFAGEDNRDAARAAAWRLLVAHEEPERAARDSKMSMLVLEPLRFAIALRPTRIALEQVPPVLDLWQFFASLLESVGYRCWAGILNAADYGVPQTRQRAILMASLDGQPHPPAPTHCKGGALTLDGELAPWVSMADALGWGTPVRPYATLAGGTGGGPCYDFTGGSGAREVLLKDRREGRWVLQVTNDRPNATRRGLDEPAQTMAFGHETPRWVKESWPHTEPATTIAGDPRITARCHHEEGSQGRDPKTTEQVQNGEYEGTEPIRLTVAEASILQGFPETYPWQGTKTSIHTQLGNAVPPPLARAVIASLLHG